MRMTRVFCIFKTLAYMVFMGCMGLFFVACAFGLGGGNIKAEYYSTVLPTYDFDTNAPTIIVADPWDLSSKFYAGHALEAFKKRGFNNVYLQGQIDPSFARNIIYVKVTKDKIDPSKNYQYTFNATGVCNVIDGVPRCSVDTRNSEVAPNQVKRAIRDSYKISFDWFDVYKKTRVLFVAGAMSVDTGIYTDLQVLNVLMNDTITRMDFKKPVQYYYNTSLK